MPLHLRILGPPELSAGDEPLELPPPWALLLLGFVASHDQGVSRSDVVATFWPDEEERKARHNLSQLLYRYRGTAWSDGLEVGPSRLRWLGECDVPAFREVVVSGDWQPAVRLYRGELLAGVQAVRSVQVSAWLETERAELLSAWREATLAYAGQLGEEGRHGDAADAIRRVLSVEILAEDLLQAYMRSSRLAGRRAQGLELFDRFRGRLQEELGIDPLPATTALAEQLREPANEDLKSEDLSQELRAPAKPEREDRAREEGVAVAPVSLPAQRTPFIGRDIELAELASTFSNPSWRLLTVLGPGGVGKSRMAVQVASEQVGRFRDGVFFVPLAPLASHEYIASALAAAVGLDNSAEEAEHRLRAHLAGKQMLLVLDNFEHVLGGVPLIDSLLEAAPAVRILATSREPLALQQEWCYELRGLSYPEGDDEFAQVYDAVQLFLSTARRVDPSFVLGNAEMPGVVRICRLLGGLPLGLELAGSWLRLLSVDELVRSLEDDFDLLESAQADRPARHHSLRAVFENSWSLLSEQERDALTRLAVFRGGFDRESAQAVSQSSLKTLLALANKSLLGRSQRGRFELLVPVRQYAEEKLAAHEDELEGARQRHAQHFATLAQSAELGLQGPDQAVWMERLELERDNLRSAFDWAAESAEVELGLRAAAALQQFWWVRGPYREGSRTIQRFLDAPFPKAVSGVPGTDMDEPERLAELQSLRGKAMHRAGTLLQEEGDYERARHHYRQALGLAREWGHDQLAADALHSLGLLETKRGENRAAFAYYEESAALQRELGDIWGLSVTLNNIGVTLMQQGQYQTAVPQLQESLELKRELGEDQGVAYAFHNLGMVHYWSGDLERAESYNQESLELKERVGDEQGMCTSIANLGRFALQAGQFEVALGHFTTSVRRLAQLNNQWSLLWVLTAVVKLEASAGRPKRALLLAGSISALARRLGVSLPAPNEQEMAGGIEVGTETLGHEYAQRLLLEGQSMGLEKAVSLVLGSKAISGRLAE